MKTFISSLVFLVVLSTAYSNPKSINDYLQSFAKQPHEKTFNQTGLLEQTEMRLVSSLTQTREFNEGELGDWYDYRKTEVAFNDDGLMTEVYEFMNDNETMQLQIFMKMDLEYNEQRQMAKAMVYIFIPEMAQFMEFMKMESKYDDDGNMIETIINQFDFMSMEWFVYTKTDYQFIDGKLIKENVFQYDNTTSELVNSNYIDYFYDNEGYLESTIEYEYDDTINEFVLSTKYEFLRDADNKVNEKKGYYRDDNNEEWLIDEIVMYNYDENGNPTEELVKWDIVDNNELDDYSKNEYLYATDVLYEDYQMPPKNFFSPEYSEYIVNVPTGYNEYYKSDDDWEIEYHTLYSYANVLSSVNENDDKFILYPIPANDILFFESKTDFSTSTIELYNLSGKMMFTSSINNNDKINVGDLSAGLYIYKIKLNNSIYTGKIIIK